MTLPLNLIQLTQSHRNVQIKYFLVGTSLVVQWLRIHMLQGNRACKPQLQSHALQGRPHMLQLRPDVAAKNKLIN